MNVLSLFDGMSCGQIALERANIKVNTYWASEIKDHAIKLVQKRYPATIQLGDIRNIRKLPGWMDLIIGGSPCKGISGLNPDKLGLEHTESALFWEYVRLYEMALKQNPNVYFLLENTKGNKNAIDTISKTLKVRPIKLNSSWVSAQSRPRLYWTNIPVNTLPKKLHITTKDIFSDEFPPDLICSDARARWIAGDKGQYSIRKGYTAVNPYPHANCLTIRGEKSWNCNYLEKDGIYRRLSINECEALQTLPIGYCDGLSYNDAYDLIGDGWTIDIIVHFFKHLKIR